MPDRDPFVHGRFRYGPWHGGPDPLAPPYDVRAALDEVGRDVLAGGSLNEALRELLRRGLDGRPGLDELGDRVRRMRRKARRRGDLAGTLDQVRAALDQALAAERDTLAGQDDDAARLAEMELATLPDDVAGQVRALADYDWQSPEARAAYESIKDMLRNEVLDAQFAGMKQALTSGDPQAMQAVRDMLADLNALLAAHARGEDTTDHFNEFMGKHGDLFPEEPKDVDELIDALARRQAAAARMMASLSPEQREELAQLMSDALADADLASEMAQLSDNLRALRPGMDQRSPVGMQPGGRVRSATATRSRRWPSWPTSSPSSSSWPRATPARPWTTWTSSGWSSGWAPPRRATCEALRELERELEKQGYLSRGDDGLRLTPRAVRRLGETALKSVFATLDASGRGDHDDQHTGQADERTGLTRPWVFGDELPLDAVAHGRQRAQPGGAALGRGAAEGRGLRGGRDRAAHDRRGRPLRRPVVLDGAGGPLGPDEADRAGALAPGGDPVPPGRPAGDRVQPRRAPALTGAAGRRRARMGAGHQPAARADAGLTARAPPSGRRAGRARGHRRRADRPHRRRRRAGVPVADHPADAARHRGPGGRAQPGTAPR